MAKGEIIGPEIISLILSRDARRNANKRKMREYEEQRLKKNQAQSTPSYSVSSSIVSPEVQTVLEKKMYVLSELIRVNE